MAARRIEKELESSPELLDIPGASVCVHCGDADCSGTCVQNQLASGIIETIAWERPSSLHNRGSLLWRHWLTSRKACVEPEVFLLRMHEGSVGAALSFGIVAETIAVGSFALPWGLLAWLLAPGLLRTVAQDPVLSKMAVRAVGYGLPSLAILLVLAHAVHGLGTYLGAKRAGAVQGMDQGWRAALRFGLYACAWDITISPFGALMLLLTAGPKATLATLKLGRGLPTRSTLAFLRARYGLDGAPMKRALWTSYVAAIAVTLVLTVIILALIVTSTTH
jgi:hypothetical protein